MNEELLVRTFNAYRQGLRKRGPISTSMGPRDFDALMFLGSIGRIPLTERPKLRQLQNLCTKALEAARQGELIESEQHYESAQKYLEGLAEGSRFAWLIGTCFYQAGVAYLRFRNWDVPSARSHLELAMDADLELECAGFPVLQMHRIQQGHNIVRMDFRLGHRQSALELTGLLVAYMERQIDTLPYHHDWRPDQLGPRPLIQSMIHQVLAETASQVVTHETSSPEWEILIETSRLAPNPEKTYFPQAQYALRAQSDRIQGDFEGYLLNLERFFLLGIRGAHTLWYALLAELMDFYLDLGTPISIQAANTLMSDSAKWKAVPSYLQNRFRTEMRSLVA